MDEKKDRNSSRRNFLKKVGIGVGAVSVTGVAGMDSKRKAEEDIL